jgi:hypothetical protein
MARNLTIATLITRCKQRCDREGDSHISDSEWQSLISEKYGELYLAVAESGMRYFETEATLTLAATIALPSAHLATLGVDFVIDSAGRRRPLTEIMHQERPQMLGETGEARFYALVGQNIELYPLPSTGTYKHLYVPQPTDVSASATSTSLDVVTPDGETFLINAVAVPALGKSESDVRLARIERDEAKERLVEWARLRSFATPRRLVRIEPGLPRDFEQGDW